MKYTFLAVILLLFTTPVSAETLTFDQIKESVCRVNADTETKDTVNGGYRQIRGSGITFLEKNNKMFILTNAHVVAKDKEVELDFFDVNDFRERVTGEVAWRAKGKNFTEGIDFAIIVVNKSSFRKPPRVIPLVDKNYVLQNGTKIYSVGLPQARWPMAWRGKIQTRRGDLAAFTPNPFAGQSGSGILVDVTDKNGKKHTRIAAVLTVRSVNTFFTRSGELIGMGGACYISTLYKLIGG